MKLRIIASVAVGVFIMIYAWFGIWLGSFDWTPRRGDASGVYFLCTIAGAVAGMIAFFNWPEKEPPSS